jgi:hypothetical protein
VFEVHSTSTPPPRPLEILDVPSLPEVPISPNRQAIAIAGALAGLVAWQASLCEAGACAAHPQCPLEAPRCAQTGPGGTLGAANTECLRYILWRGIWAGLAAVSQPNATYLRPPAQIVGRTP